DEVAMRCEARPLFSSRFEATLRDDREAVVAVVEVERGARFRRDDLRVLNGLHLERLRIVAASAPGFGEAPRCIERRRKLDQGREPGELVERARGTARVSDTELDLAQISPGVRLLAPPARGLRPRDQNFGALVLGALRGFIARLGRERARDRKQD